MWWENRLLKYFRDPKATPEDREAAADLWVHWKQHRPKDLGNFAVSEQAAYVGGAIRRVRRTRGRRWRREAGDIEIASEPATLQSPEATCLLRQLLSMLGPREAAAVTMCAEGFDS